MGEREKRDRKKVTEKQRDREIERQRGRGRIGELRGIECGQWRDRNG